MPARSEPTPSIRDEDLIDLFSRRLPDLLERRPDLEPALFHAFLKTFARREEVALVVTELRALRTEMESRFDQVDRRADRADERFEQFHAEVADRFDKADERHDQLRAEVADGFDRMQRSIDRLGSRCGILNGSLVRRTVAALLEKSFVVREEQRTIAGEQFDVVIHDHHHVLVEIACRAGSDIQNRLERKRRLYEESTGVRPARVILATASIHSARARQLQQAGFEVIEPEDPE